MTTAKETTPETVTENRVSPFDKQQPPSGTPPLSAAQTAHDLGNFLTGIQMLVSSLSHITPRDRAVQQHFVSLQRAVLQTSELCGQLQKRLTGENGALELDVCEVDISLLVDEMRHLLQVLMTPDTTLNMETVVALPPVHANPTQLRQVVLDLFTNGLDALGREGGAITIRTGVFETRENRPIAEDGGPWPPTSNAGETTAGGQCCGDACVYLEVADTGCGIAEDQLQQIFRPAFTTKKDGQGLGLTSVLQIVHGYGGAVTVDSRVGEGTRVRCTFPALTPGHSDPADAEATQAPIVENSEFGVTTILLVEDNEATRHGSKWLLENSGHGDFRVLTVSNGQQAMDLFRRRGEEISVVILDLNLPDCRGVDLFQHLRQKAPTLPVIVTSALPQQQLTAQCDDQQPTGFLVKPFDGNALIQEVESMLRSSDLQVGNPVAECATCRWKGTAR